MRSLQVTSLEGPSSVQVTEVEEPSAGPDQVVVEVKAVGISWPDLLQTRGEYQIKPDLPFQLGVDFAGVVRSAPEGSGHAAGDRVACVLPYGGGADVVALHPESVFALPDNVSFEAGAALPMNYLTAEFALVTRAGLREGETVLVNGAAGGVGTAAIQVAKGLGARVIALTSTEEKAEFARSAGADEAVLVDGFRDAVKELTDGRGVDVLVDVVGGDLMTDSLRSLAPLGRLLVLGFTGGEIPQVKVNRLLLNNVDVRGVGWGAYAMTRQGYMREQWQRLVPMLESGVVDPPIGRTYGLDDVQDALVEMAERRTLGKSVLLL
ncbi:NADPH:quinone oxidoreductase family protein [Nocardioides sp. HDW12B]|uniref:NADPH:quinone oxidoreductase family protein n=1 Tax=Nocardioides sp. HDW12B TaxID=2714939 RepID=UPI00140DDAB7|nr:NADPH:quinone oxidoreductase family protein [Nocardioides sp. HDW12B]QIK67885.1 NADPH:quinone oxidoreductase family protein [Nocardioides sp. HDW12B]